MTKLGRFIEHKQVHQFDNFHYNVVLDLDTMSILFVHNSMAAHALSGKKTPTPKPSSPEHIEMISHSHAMISESICSRFGNTVFNVAE